MNNHKNVSCHCQTYGKQDVEICEKQLNTNQALKIFRSTLLSILIAFFPKCPFCWAAYMSMFGSIGLAQLPYMNWLLPVMLIFLAIHLLILLKRSSVQGYIPFLLSLAGAIIILCARGFFASEKWILIVGMILIASGSILNNISRRSFPFRFKLSTNN
ncbi:MAG: hypothetical protein ABIN67_01590 [Ferruginibacter sp.]